jgi:hypothetical protein
MINLPDQAGVVSLDEDDEERAATSTADEMRERIARLEARIEELTQSIEGCRKIALASKGLIAGGVILLVIIIIGAIRPDLLALSAAIAAVLGGIVLFGSNNSTSKQKNAALRAAEAERADLMGKIGLTLVGERGAGSLARPS